jgi:hypothetical protein
MTRKREEAQPGTSTTSQSPELRTYVDALAAIVPAEVLTAHAAVLTFTTTTDKTLVTIQAEATLFLVFWALTGLSMLLYTTGRLTASSWDGWGFVRILIPTFDKASTPAPFVGKSGLVCHIRTGHSD